MAKGLTELIAAIILLGIVILVGILTIAWHEQYVGHEQSRTACVPDTNFIIDGVTHDEGAGVLRIKLVNHGKISLYGFGVTLYTDTDVYNFEVEEVDQGGISADRKLGREEESYIFVNLTGVAAFRDIKEILITNEECKPVTTGSLKGIGWI